MSNVYIAGPMSGLPLFNHSAFDSAERWLKKNYPVSQIFNPAQHDREMGFDPRTATVEEVEKFSVREALATDLSWIALNADFLVVLPGWQNSWGTAAELALARAIKIPAFELEEFKVDFTLAPNIAERELERV